MPLQGVRSYVATPRDWTNAPAIIVHHHRLRPRWQAAEMGVFIPSLNSRIPSWLGTDTLSATGHEQPSPGSDHRDRHVRGAGPRAHVHPALRLHRQLARDLDRAVDRTARPRRGRGCPLALSALGRAAPRSARARRGAVLPGRGGDRRARRCRRSWRCRSCRSRSRACWSRTRMPRAAATPHARPMPSICSPRRAAVWSRRVCSVRSSPTEIMTVLGLICCGLALMLVERRRRAVVAIALIAVAHVSLLVAGRAGDLPDGPLEVLLRSDPHSEKAIVEAGTSSRDVLDSVVESARSPRRAPSARRTRPSSACSPMA